MSNEARTDRAARRMGPGGRRETSERNRGDGATRKDILVLVPGLAGILYALFALGEGTAPYHGLLAGGCAYLAVVMGVPGIRSGKGLRVFPPLFLAVVALLNLGRVFLHHGSLWFLAISGGLLLAMLVGSFPVLMRFYRDQQDERERRLFTESGLLAFVATLLASVIYWMLERLPEARGELSRLAFELPDPSAIWVVFFGLGTWAVAWAVLRWRRF